MTQKYKNKTKNRLLESEGLKINIFKQANIIKSIVQVYFLICCTVFVFSRNLIY